MKLVAEAISNLSILLGVLTTRKWYDTGYGIK